MANRDPAMWHATRPQSFVAGSLRCFGGQRSPKTRLLTPFSPRESPWGFRFKRAKRQTGRPIRRVLSGCRVATTSVTAISLGTTLPQPSSGLPGNSASSLNVPCLTLLRTRFTQRARSLGPLVVSYTTVSPLPPVRGLEAVCSLLHFLADCSGWVLPTVLLCGARTFLGTLPKKRDATAWPTRLRCQA